MVVIQFPSKSSRQRPPLSERILYNVLGFALLTAVTAWYGWDRLHRIDNPGGFADLSEGSFSFRGTAGPKIPHRLIFTYKTDLLHDETPAHFYNNIMNTVRMYREVWNEPKAPILFLQNPECRSLIQEAEPELVKYFDQTTGPFKADLCRVAALYLKGGYYFDIDMKAMTPVLLANDVSFATVESTYEVDDEADDDEAGNDKTEEDNAENSSKSFFQSFLASERGNPILKKALQVMKEYYDARSNGTEQEELMGPITLRQAYESVPSKKRGIAYLLEEIHLNYSKRELYPDVALQDGYGGNCNWMVHDPDTHVLHFFS